MYICMCIYIERVVNTADAFHFKNSSSALLVHEQKTPQK